MMTEIEKKALALVSEVLGVRLLLFERSDSHIHEALCRAIEHHVAFRQKVSDAVEAYNDLWRKRTPGRDEFMGHFIRFIIAKPDPLVEDFGHDLAADIRAAIEKRGGRVVWGEG